MQFHEKIIFDLFDFTSFFAWTFLIFLARCGTVDSQINWKTYVHVSETPDL